KPASVHNGDGGRIAGSVGVVMSAGGTVENDNAVIEASASNGVQILGAPGTVSNRNGGIISGGENGLWLDMGGTVFNDATSTVRSTGVVNGGVAIGSNGGPGGALTLTNAGTIIGNVQMAASAANTTTLVAGGVIDGNLQIGSNTN